MGKGRYHACVKYFAAYVCILCMKHTACFLLCQSLVHGGMADAFLGDNNRHANIFLEGEDL